MVMHTRPAASVAPWAGQRLPQLAREALREPARSVPSYGFDLVPVLTHAVRAFRRRLLRRVAVAAVFGLVAVWEPLPPLILLATLCLARLLGSNWPPLTLFCLWLAFRAPSLLFALFGPQDWKNKYEAFAHDAPLLVLASALALVYVADAVVARSARDRAGREGGDRERMPTVGPRARRRVERVGLQQNGTALPYDGQGRFIGAGRESRGAVEIRVPLRPGRSGRPVVALRETELLAGIEAAMSTAARGAGRPDDLTETEPLPGFSVAQVLALPAALWLERGRGGAGASETAGGLGRPDRLYLRAQCVSWQGQLVVSLFVHAALQAGELRLTLRPQVMAPLLPLPEPIGSAVLEGLRAMEGLWAGPVKETAPGADPAGAEGPLSLRDLLSLPTIPDVHQSSDAARHVELMQAAVLGAVEALLERHGFATDALSDRHTVINSIQVLGDNNAGIQLAGGLTLAQVTQTTPIAPASTEGVPMSPGFPHRNPPSEPARAPGSGISIGGDNSGTAQNAVGHRLSHITQTGAGQGNAPLESVAALLASFRADIDRNAALLADLEALRDQTTTLSGALTAPQGEGFRPALRMAVRSLPALVAGTAVQQTGDALVTAIGELLG
ncbi:hypothetical protein [Streptomyces sp. NPDC048295]|uniref:hypothetical protein n=1 Tax=Streptomyces sp. NPDC048295 TaxID=3154617 RepID=UPI00341BACA3